MKCSFDGHRPRKKWGQNFLRNQQVIWQIIHAIAPKNSDHIVEIGPGQGALTWLLAKRCHRMNLIELDGDLVHSLSHRLATMDVNVAVHLADALQFNLYHISQKNAHFV